MVDYHLKLGVGPRDLVVGVVDLASPPEIYARVTAVLDDPVGTAMDVAAVVENDPGLSARILRLVNSAFYGFPSQISTVTRAVTIIGVRELRDLVLATAVLELFNGLPNQLVSMASFWHGSLRCAVLAKILASQHYRQEPVESMFIAGLLHEIGHPIMYRKLPELAREAILRHKHAGIELYAAERDVLGFDYAAVGGELMRVWKLPPMLHEVVELHLNPELSQRFAVETAIVHLACRLAGAGSFDLAQVATVIAADATAWKRAGLSPDVLGPTLAAAQEQYEAALAFVG